MSKKKKSSSSQEEYVPKYKKSTYTDDEKFDYYKGKSKEELADIIIRRGNALQKKTAKKKTYKKQAYGKGSQRGNYRGQSIVYPNIVGSGPYEVSGDLTLDWPMLGVQGRAGGKYYSGSGPYVRKQRSQFGDIPVCSTVPKMFSGLCNGEANCVRFQEYLFDLLPAAGTGEGGSGSSPLDIQTFNIQPGNTTLFPWLSQMSNLYQEYRITALILEFRTMSTDYSTNTTLGSVFMGVNYNSNSIPPTTKQQVEMLEGGVSAKPSQTFLFPIECEKSVNGNVHKYVVYDGAYPSNSFDINLYDWGKLYIGSSGIPNPATGPAPLGEVWISYEVMFFKPEVITSQNFFSNVIPLHVYSAGVSTPTATFQGLAPFGAGDENSPIVFEVRSTANASDTIDIFVPALEVSTVWEVQVMVFRATGSSAFGGGFTSQLTTTSSGSQQLVNYLCIDNKTSYSQVSLEANSISFSVFFIQPASVSGYITLVSTLTGSGDTINADVIVTGYPSNDWL